VLEITEETITIATGQGGILVRRLRPDGEGKMAAGAWATTVGLNAGERII